MDPLAGDYPSLSPYVYTANNPILFVDPTGMAYEISEEEWMRRAATNDWVKDTPEEIERQIDEGIYDYDYLDLIAREAALGNEQYTDKWYNTANNLLDYFANQYGLPSDFLKSVAWTESNWQQYGPDGTILRGINAKSIDYGFMQINSMHIKTLGNSFTKSVFDNLVAGSNIASYSYNKSNNSGFFLNAYSVGLSAYAIYNGGPRRILRPWSKPEIGWHINDKNFRRNFGFSRWKK